MARQKVQADGFGDNRLSVEAVIEDLKERELLHVADGPLIAVARSLASAVDADPSSSQHIVQYRAAVAALRDEVQKVDAVEQSRVMWRLNTGCDEHDQTMMAHCSTCCSDEDGWTWETVERWRPPARVTFEGRADSKPVREVSDDEYARYAVIEFLRSYPHRKWDRNSFDPSD